MAPESLFRDNVNYTDAEHLIIDFVTMCPAEFLVMSIQQVSARLGVSDATVSRFARHAGFRDFKELKAAVASATVGPAEKIRTSLEGSGSARAFLEGQLENIGRTIDGLDDDAFSRAVDALSGARRVLLLGKGAAGSLAELLRFRLSRFGKEVIVLAAGSDAMEGLVHADAQSAIVAFGFQRVPAEVEIALAYARSVGAVSVLVTGRRHIGSRVSVDVELIAYRGEPRGYHSMASAVALPDALVVAVAGRMDGEAMERLERLKALKREHESRLPR